MEMQETPQALLSAVREAFYISESICAYNVLQLEEELPRDRVNGYVWWEDSHVYETMSREEPKLVSRVTAIYQSLAADYRHITDTRVADDLLAGRVEGSWSIKKLLTLTIKWSRKVAARIRRPVTEEEAVILIGLEREVLRQEMLAKRFNSDRQKVYRRLVDKLKHMYYDATGDVDIIDMTKEVSPRVCIAEVRMSVALQAAGEMGWTPMSEGTVRTLFHSLGGDRGTVRLIGMPALLPRKTWDYLLPYTTQIGGRWFRGLATADRWVEVVGLSGASAGLSTLFGKKAIEGRRATEFSWSVEVDRPTLTRLPAGSISSIMWWVGPRNVITRRLYDELTRMAAAGARGTGRGTGRVWHTAREALLRENPQLAWQVVLPSLTQRSVVAIHAGSRSYGAFREGLLERILAMLPDDDFFTEENGVTLAVSRQNDSVVWSVTRQPDGGGERDKCELFANRMMQGIYSIYEQRGLYVGRGKDVDLPKNRSDEKADFVVSKTEWPDIEALRFMRLEEIGSERLQSTPEGIG